MEVLALAELASSADTTERRRGRGHSSGMDERQRTQRETIHVRKPGESMKSEITMTI